MICYLPVAVMGSWVRHWEYFVHCRDTESWAKPSNPDVFIFLEKRFLAPVVLGFRHFPFYAQLIPAVSIL